MLRSSATMKDIVQLDDNNNNATDMTHLNGAKALTNGSPGSLITNGLNGTAVAKLPCKCDKGKPRKVDKIPLN